MKGNPKDEGTLQRLESRHRSETNKQDHNQKERSDKFCKERTMDMSANGFPNTDDSYSFCCL